jgi:hypothetical protein
MGETEMEERNNPTPENIPEEQAQHSPAANKWAQLKA